MDKGKSSLEKDIMKRIDKLKFEYEQLKIDWINTGNNIPTANENNMVNRKKIIESIFNELGVNFKK
jgi:hypothetical protein